MKQVLLKNLPKVDEILKEDRIKALMERMPREKVVDLIRSSLESRRENILSERIRSAEDLKLRNLIDEIEAEAENSMPGSLRPVINATGVILHTNLGRAVLSEKAIKRVVETAGSYSTLEYDPAEGKRSNRQVHTEDLLKKITGAEASFAVNNNAAATMLVLAALGRGKEIIVSRGELVEIGGSFRIPEIMEESGAHLREVGTTNKTRISDYEKAINENTGALLKVHTSNYKVIGFTEEASLSELKELGMKYSLPVIYDMGSGLLTDLSQWGVREPVVKDALREGAGLVLFSGDKLLGGPQAGIIVGKKEFIDRIKSHPLARAVRADKMTFAALEGTLEDYYDRETALNNIPVIRMITESPEEIQSKAMALKQLLEDILDDKGDPAYSVKVTEEKGAVGGGSAPDSVLKSKAVSIKSSRLSAERIENGLRQGRIPVVAMIRDDSVIFDVRTLRTGDLTVIRDKLADMISGGKDL